EIKGRPAHNPIIVHVADIALAKRCVTEWPAAADRLAAAFWPGPLTMVLPRSKEIPDIVTAGGPTVGVRWPSHPFIQAVIRECGFPLAAPSANPSNQLSPTNAAHVGKELGGRLSLIVDGGQSQVGIESTVIDLALSPPWILRPGMIHEASLEAVIGKLSGFKSREPAPDALRSPGLLKKHYSPKAKLKILNWHDEAELVSHLTTDTAHRTHIIAHTRIPSGEGFGSVSVIPHDAEAFARALYAELHRCDEADAELIIVEAPPETAEWQAVTDRLNRAAAS
ncbi:MAG: threonylcarbamoyl-AMP synthase, partial [Akkermansiaceae bacterium]|nr:threonylcarbamoyl-AMP synthase [Verrucomicrobiales bacterium]